MKRTGSIRHTAVTAALIAALTAAAVGAAEVRDPILRADLALIVQELERIEHVIDRLAARQHRLPDQRVILDVVQLRADINAIQAGIREFLSPPRLPPRHLAPLSGDYLEQRPGGAP